jgi:hypothetical protein
LIRLLLNVLAGILSFLVMGWGLYSVMSVDFRLNPALTILYCAIPILCFPLFLLVRLRRKPAWWMGVAGCAFLAVYSMLNWRSCSALAVCGSVAGTVWMTLWTFPVLAFFCTTVASWAAMALRECPPELRPNKTDSA